MLSISTPPCRPSTARPDTAFPPLAAGGTVGLGEARPDIESVTLAARPEVSLTR